MNEPTNDNDIDALLAFLGRMAMPKQHAALAALVAERDALKEENNALRSRQKSHQDEVLDRMFEMDALRKRVAELERELAAAKAELAIMQKQRDEALDERSYWYREHSRLIEKLVSLEREDNERKRLDAIERIDAMTRWMDQVTAMLCHSMTHSHDAKQELVTRCDKAIAAMRKGEA